MRRSGFSQLHPAVALGFFAGAIGLAVLANHPAYQAVGLICAVLGYASFKGRDAMAPLGALALAFCALTLLNPLFIPQGETVLFTYLGGRPYTLQGLALGASTAAMFATVMLWFGCLNASLSSEKLTFLFGKVAPSLTLVLTMVLRLVPLYQRKAHQISTARRGVGLSVWEGPVVDRVRSGAAELSALATWGLEGAIVTADSMRSRGFGTGKRTSFAGYRFTSGDGLSALALSVLFALALAGALSDGATLFLPALSLPPLGVLGKAGLAAYGLFAIYPVLINEGGALRWRIALR